jgi:hypothetical protein
LDKYNLSAEEYKRWTPHTGVKREAHGASCPAFDE